jgi:hypothetical protein
MKQPQSLEGPQTLLLRRHFVLDLPAEPPSLSPGRAKGAHQPHIGDNVGQIASDARRTISEAIEQATAAGGKSPDHAADQHGERRQHCRHTPVHKTEHRDAADHRCGGRQSHPGQRIFEAECSIGSGGNAPGDGTREAIGKILRAVAGQMLEETDAQIAGDCDKGSGRDPAGQPP